MFSKLRLFAKYNEHVASSSPINKLFGGVKHYAIDKTEIIDINIENMMFDENPEERSDRMLTKEAPLQSVGIDGSPIAPVDINPWIEEEEYKQGTVLEDTIERKEIISVVPEPPKDRSGIYQFKGIKIVLPKKLLRPETYRYRLDQEDVDRLADDIRICKFDK